MIGTGLAILGAGLAGAGASMYAANKASETQSNAANQAAALQAKAMNDRLEFQKQNYATTSGNLDPFISGGKGATNLLQSFYGMGGDQAAGQSALARFQQSPDYQFALKGGSQALDNSAAARGNVLSGNQIRAQTEFGSGLATQNLQNYLTRLSSMAGQGIQSSGYLGQIGTGVGSDLNTGANNTGNSLMAAGTADASGILGVAKGFNSGLSTLQQYNDMSRSSYGGGSGGGTGFNLNRTGGLY